MSQQSVAHDTVSLTVNGEERRLRAGSSIADLLSAHELDRRVVVVEHNRTVLRDREGYENVQLSDGDVIEIVHFVGGG